MLAVDETHFFRQVVSSRLEAAHFFLQILAFLPDPCELVLLRLEFFLGRLRRDGSRCSGKNKNREREVKGSQLGPGG